MRTSGGKRFEKPRVHRYLAEIASSQRNVIEHGFLSFAAEGNRASLAKLGESCAWRPRPFASDRDLASRLVSPAGGSLGTCCRGCAAFLWCLAVMLPWFRN